jgi:hypothetical protein
MSGDPGIRRRALMKHPAVTQRRRPAAHTSDRRPATPEIAAEASALGLAADRTEEDLPIVAVAAAARELLARTAELPGGKRELLATLSEYRAAVYALAAAADQL